jgi:hypothetical protein
VRFGWAEAFCFFVRRWLVFCGMRLDSLGVFLGLVGGDKGPGGGNPDRTESCGIDANQLPDRAGKVNNLVVAGMTGREG